MAADIEAYQKLITELSPTKVKLVAVSKTKPIEDIMVLYSEGQRLFGENYVQEMMAKQPQLPDDIQWHFIGHLQTNKVKQIASFVHMIQSVDSVKLLQEIHKQGAKYQRIIPVLLQVHIAEESTKFGFDAKELADLLKEETISKYPFAQISGLMGMATNTNDLQQVRKEFFSLKKLFDDSKQTYFSAVDHFTELSMGMTHDYPIAIEAGATIVRIGSLLFGSRS